MCGTLAGSKLSQGHMGIMIDGKTFYSHRLAWFYMHKEWPPEMLDHINGVRDDNRLENLRLATRSLNLQNQRKASKNNKCGFLGVHRKKGCPVNPYVAELRVNGKIKRIGYYSTPEIAHQAYLEAKRKYHLGCTI